MIKFYPLALKGTLGFAQSQVTKGGVPASELTPALESKILPGAYLVGEVIDVDGDCGGYNLQWAFASAYAAAEAILQSLGK